MQRQPSLHPRSFSGCFFLLAPLLVWIAFSNTAAAEESPPTQEESPSSGITGFLDEYHTLMLGEIKGQTLWFDNFFGDRRTEEDDQPTSFVRLRTVARFTEGTGMTFPIRLRANLELPRVNRRLRLVIFGGNREEDRLMEANDTIDPALKNGEEKDWTNLGLRYMIYRSLRDRFNFGGGLSLGWPLDYYGRMRYERLLHNSKNSSILFSETGFWKSLTGFGETSQIDMEKILNDILTGRLTFFATYSAERPGLQWGVESSLFRQLSKRSALALDLGVYALNRPSTQISYRIAGRYRQNFLRPWLFFEIEPELDFLQSENGERDTVGVLTTVLEVQFIT